VEEYLKRQGRFRHLFEPERDDKTIAHIQATVDDYWHQWSPNETTTRRNP
jgi:pyruvate ferredoxin oxidoreductase beta subunit